MKLQNFLYLAIISLFYLFLSPSNSYAFTTLVLNNPTAPPLTTNDKSGLLDIIAQKAFQQAGFKLELVRLPAERALLNANEGIEDGDLSRIAGIEKTYQNLRRIPEHLFVMNFVAFSNQKNLVIENWESLKGLNVAIIRGWKIFENNTKSISSVHSVENAHLLFNMLDKKRVDVVLYSKWLGLGYIKKHNLQEINLVGKPLATKNMYIYLHKKHMRHIDIITKKLRELKTSGFYQTVYDKKYDLLQ